MNDVELHDALARHARALDRRAPTITAGDVDVRLTTAPGQYRGARRAVPVAIALVLVVAVVMTAAVLRGTSRETGPDHPSGPDARRLSRYHWSTLPTPPYATRFGTSSVWTGRELLQWSGQFLGPELVTPDVGTAFDPAAGAWRVLPASPLSGRFDTATVWTGNEMLVWGGTDGATLSTVFADGAAYDPATDTWRSLPASPLTARAAPQSVWTGREMIVVGGERVVGGTTDVVLDAAAYDPARNRWRALPALPARAGHQVGSTVALWIGDRLLVWERWTSTDSLSRFPAGGVDLVTYRPGERRWHLVPAAAGAPRSIDHPVWTGRDVIVPPTAAQTPDPTFTGGTSGAWRYDPRANRWTALPPGPMDDVPATTVWTGRAVVFVDASALTFVGPDGSSPPGGSAAFDPRANRWYRVESPPFRNADSGVPLVWTGHEVLAPGAVPPTVNPAPAGAAFGGLRLGP